MALPVVTCKSLSYKQPLPHAHFTTNPPRISAHVNHDAHPHKVAALFIEEHVLSSGTMFYIRNDSYTDQNPTFMLARSSTDSRSRMGIYWTVKF
ncbi:hypothetical protein FRC08_003741 [Ceratobasidium sp. 394]|nr:hypothetical protein FRC08_003741 [Ceratobasidium sp. 394]